MDGPFGQAPMLNFNSSIEAIKEIQAKGPLTKRMLIVATAKALAENIPIDISNQHRQGRADDVRPFSSAPSMLCLIQFSRIP